MVLINQNNNIYFYSHLIQQLNNFNKQNQKLSTFKDKMKFSQSDRVLHDSNFNPPCNYYNPDKKEEKKVLTGTLAGPTLFNYDKSNFGYTKRSSQEKNSIGPGPGQYFQIKKEVVYNFKRDLSNPKEFLKNTFKPQQQNPSIPYKIIDQEKFDQQQRAFIKELTLQQNPAKALQITRKKDPSFSFSKSPRKLLEQINNVKKQSNLQNGQMYLHKHDTQKGSQKQELQSIRQMNGLKQKVKNSYALGVSEAIRKASKKRNEIINNIGSDFVPSLELVDLMSKMRTKYGPGPGFYNPNNNSFTKQIENLAESNKKGSIFSSVKRFNTDKKSLLGPGQYQVNDESFSKKGGKFSKQKRAIINTRDRTDAEFRFYISINEREASAFSRVQRSSSCSGIKNNNIFRSEQGRNGFGSSSKRFSTVSLPKVETDKKPQPSEYEVQKMNNFKIQIKARMKKLKQEDRRSTKEDSGLLGISTMATLLD